MTNSIDQLKIEVGNIKNSLNELKNNVTLSEKEKKDKAENLKKQAETTKQKIQAEIDALANKTDNDSKKKKEEAETLLNSFNEILGLYTTIIASADKKKNENEQEQSQQKENSEKEKNGFTKSKEWIGEQRNDVISGSKRKQEPGKNIARAVGFGITGVAIYKGIKGLWNWAFGKKKNKKEKNESEGGEKKGFWDRWYGKAIKRTGIGGGVYYIAKGLITGDWSIFGRNPFSKEKKDGPNTTPGSEIERSEKAYDKLSEEDKKIYESSANAINEYQGNVMGDQGGSEIVEDIMGDSEFDKDKIGLVPFILSNRYASLDKMLSETSLYYEIVGTEGHIAWDKLKNLGLDGLKKILTPLVGAVNGLTFDILNLDDGLDNLIEKLKGIDGLEQILRTVFRKSITVMSYYQSRKGVLENYLAEQELIRQNPKFMGLSDEEKAEEIADYLQNEEWYEQHIKPEISKFMNMNIKEATVYLQEKGLLNGELDLQMKVAIEKVDKNRRDLLNIEDDDDTSNLDDLKKELNNGKLSEKAMKKLKNICEEFEEDIFTNGKQTRYAKYLPMFQIFGANEQFLHDIQQTGDYDNIAKKYMEQVNGILQKAESGTLEESDLDLLEDTINDYYKFQKSLVSSEINVGKMVDDNGNIVFRRGRSIWAGGENVWSGIQIVTGLKDGSNREGAGLIAGGIISVDALTFGLASRKLVGFSPFWTLNKKVVFPIAKGGLRLTGKGIERLTGNTVRASLPSRVSYKYYNKDTFRIAVGRGEISLEKAAKIAKRQGLTFGSGSMAGNGKLVETPEDLIHYLFGPEQDAKKIVNIVEKYGDNPRIYRELFPEYYQNISGKRRKPQERFHMNRSNMKFRVDESALKKLEDVATRIDNMPVGTQKTVMQSMMKSIKTIDQAEDLARMGVGDDMVRLLESGKFMKAEQYGKYLAKYAGKVDVNDMRAFEKFIIEARNSNKVGENGNLFIRNAMKNFSKIKENGFAIDKIDDLALNSSKWTKLAESTKVNCEKMSSNLKKMANNPKFKPFAKNIKKGAQAVEEFAKTITPNGMKAIKNMSIFGKESAFAKLSAEGMHELSRLSYMLKDVDLANDLSKSLRGAKTIDNVKDILRQQGIVVNHIDDAVLLKIAKSGNAKKIRDIVNYGAEFKAIQGVKKLMSNPAIKQIGRVGGKALVGLDFVFVGYNFYSQFGEAQEIKKHNQERGKRKENQAYFELGAGGLGAVAGVCMFIPGAGWVAGGVLAASMGAIEVGKKYYEDIEKFKQNQSDFLSKGIAATKQELTSIDSWDQGLSRTWMDAINLFGSETKKQIGSPKTKSEALKALIKMEELQKNPLAGADLNDPEVVKDSELVEAIRQAKQQVDEIVEKRFNYFKINYLDKNQPLIDRSKHKGNQAISIIEDLLEKSSINYIMESDPSYQGDKNPEKYKETKLMKLKEGNEGNFAKLEKLFIENPTSLFQMYAELPYYKSMLIQYGDDEQIKLLDSCEYFEQYMNYKMMGKSITSYPRIDINPDDIDYNQIHNLLSHFALIPTVLDDAESKNYKGLSDKEILEKYGVSGILGQDILFECARLLNYDGKNSLDELKLFFHESKKNVNGIYYNDKQRVINENWASDDKFATDSELDSLANIEKMRKYVNENVNSGRNGKMITESSGINKEIGNKMVGIIDDYIALRKGNIKGGIDDYVRKHSTNGKYIALPIDLIIKGRKAGMKGVGEHLYKYENGMLAVK